MASISQSFSLLLFVSFFMPSSSYEPQIPFAEIQADNRPNIVLHTFWFDKPGQLNLHVSNLNLSSINNNLDLNKVGFSLITKDSWLCFIQKMNVIDNGNITCPLESDLVRPIVTLDAFKGTRDFYVTFNVTKSGELLLQLLNCVPDLEISMKVGFAISYDELVGFQIYILFYDMYLLLTILWICSLDSHEPGLLYVHLLMVFVLLLKAMHVLSELPYETVINTWINPIHLLKLSKGSTLLTLIILIIIDWPRIKHNLENKGDKMLAMVIPLQIVANIVMVVFGHTNVMIFRLIDLICACIVFLRILLAVIQVARIDRKAAVKFVYFVNFWWYYIAAGYYLIIMQVWSDSVVTTTSNRDEWAMMVQCELANIAFYILTGYKFRPKLPENYSVLDQEEKDPADEAMKLEEGCLKTMISADMVMM